MNSQVWWQGRAGRVVEWWQLGMYKWGAMRSYVLQGLAIANRGEDGWDVRRMGCRRCPELVAGWYAPVEVEGVTHRQGGGECNSEDE